MNFQLCTLKLIPKKWGNSSKYKNLKDRNFEFLFILINPHMELLDVVNIKLSLI